MTPDREAAIIVNDLDSMVHRIESLPAHPKYSDALVAVLNAKQAIIEGLADIRQDAAHGRWGA